MNDMPSFEAIPLSVYAMSDNVINFSAVAAGDEAGVAAKLDEVGDGFKIISAGNLMQRDIKYNWLISGLFEHHSLGMIFGATGSGKSFIALDMAVCIGAGIPYCNRATDKGKVVYICGEGLSGLTRRLKALSKKYDVDFSDDVYVSLQPGELMHAPNVAAIAMAIEAIGGVSMIIIDTYHRNMGGGNENSSDDFGLVLRNIDAHIKPMGITVLIIHHSGHLSTDRSRGTSAIRAAMDFEYMAEKIDSIVNLSPTKIKDADMPPLLSFDFITKVLGYDDEDDPITSAYLDYQQGREVKIKQSMRVNCVLDALCDALRDHGVCPNSAIKDKYAGFNRGQLVCSINQWRQFAYRVISVECDNKDGEQNAKKIAFQRAKADLVKKGTICIYDDYVWITTV